MNDVDPNETLVIATEIETTDSPMGKDVDSLFINHDAVNHPQHYKRNPAGIEVIDIVEHLNFNQGNAIKYILRAPYKGDMRTDLEKAKWYLERELARIETYGS